MGKISAKLTESLSRFRNQRYHHSIDMLRAIAALIVVLYHFVMGSKGRFEDFHYLKYVASFGHLGVQMFFVISGFVIPYSMYLTDYKPSSFFKFLLRRLARLEPPYVISVVLCVLLAYSYLLNPYYRGSIPVFSWEQMLFHLAYLNAFFKYDWVNPVYWTLAIEFQYYIIIALIYTILLSQKKGVLPILFIIVIVVSFLIPQKEFIFIHVPFFLLGIALFLLKIKRIQISGFLSTLGVTVVWILFINDESYLFFGLFPVVIVLFTSIKNTIWSFLGGISYSLYLLHVPIGQRILNMSENFIDNEWLMFVVMLLVILLMIFISYLFGKFVERPSQQLSKKVNY